MPLRVYETRKPLDIVVWIHGGAFTAGTLDWPESHWVATELAAMGHLTVCVDYRLASSTVRYPIPSDDVLAAWSWVSSSRQWDHLGVHLGGASAGGNLALGAAIRIRDGDLQATPSATPSSLLLAYPTLHAVQPEPSAALKAKLIGCLPSDERWGPQSVLDMYAGFLGTPVDKAPVAAVPGEDRLAGLPPVLIVASDIDGLRPSAEAASAKLRGLGSRHEFAIERETRHGHLNRPDGPEGPAARRTVARFDQWLRLFASEAR